MYEGTPLVSGVWVGDVWGQKAWVNGDGFFIPAAFQFDGSASAPALDWVKGDIIQHTHYGGRTQFRWTAPSAGKVDISGSIWMVRNLGRTDSWSVELNGAALTGGTVDATWMRASSLSLALGSGGAGVLAGVSVAAGDTVDLAVQRFTTEEYTGQNLTLDFTPVPEPSSLSALALGFLFARRRSRRG